jgi:8-oxo-dGTP diphosphatase
MENCKLCAFNNPKVTVTAIIFKDNKVLCLKRNEEPYKNEWDLPGGYVNANETIETAILREIKEELNCEIANLSFLITANHEYISFKII